MEFYQKAKDAGIKPIIGYEAYVAPGSRFHKEASRDEGGQLPSHAAGQEPHRVQEPVKLASSAFLEGFYFRPRIDKEILEAHNEGLICLSGCVSSEFNRALLAGSEPEHGQGDGDRRLVRQVFGDRYYIEIQNNGLEIQRMAMRAGRRRRQADGHSAGGHQRRALRGQGRRRAQDVLLVHQHRQVPHRRQPHADGDQRVLSPQPGGDVRGVPRQRGRRAAQPGDRRQRRHRARLGKRHFPVFTAAGREDVGRLSPRAVLEGLKQQYARTAPSGCADGQLSQEVMDRLDRELGVINKLGFANYFLIVWDFVRFAREQGIEATARGSGVGSLVAYALDLSHVCPLEYDLLFERFLDLNRREAPDIDIDFCQERRGEVIQYVKEKYGAANVAQIGTFGTLAARAAIRDVGRALDMPIPRVDAIVGMVPDELHITLDEALEEERRPEEGLRHRPRGPRAARPGRSASRGWPATWARTPRRW